MLSAEVEGWDGLAIDISEITSASVPVEELKRLSRRILEDVRVIIRVRRTEGKGECVVSHKANRH